MQNQAARLSCPVNQCCSYVSFLDVDEQAIGPHNSSGFVGFISDSFFDQVVLTDPYISFSAIGMDNISFHSTVPEPTTMVLLVSGLIVLAGARRKFKK